ncbi:MAG: DUF2207 domain-containing protein [Microgenomates group bacterium]
MKKLLLSALLTLSFCIGAPSVHAEIIDSFDTNIVAHKNGDLTITEKISYDFEENIRHGIFRTIPLYTSVGNKFRIITINSVSVLRDSQPEPFSISSNAKTFTIKIGDANKTITGPHTYVLSYSVSNGIGSNFADHDEIYWNTTGNEWTVPIARAQATVSNDFGAVTIDEICFTGNYASTAHECTVQNSVFITWGFLNPGQGMSIVATYPRSTFPTSVLTNAAPQEASEKFIRTFWSVYKNILVVLNLIVAPILLLWFLVKKSKKNTGPATVRFDLPTDSEGKIVSPAISGVIERGGFTNVHFVATLFSLAIRKYIHLREEKVVKKFMPDIQEQYVTKLKDADKHVTEFEKIIMDALFKTSNEVAVSSLKSSFPTIIKDVRSSVQKTVVAQKYFVSNFHYYPVYFVLVIVFLLLTGNIVLGVLFSYFAGVLKGRTKSGDDIVKQIEGLKIFLAMRDTNYTWQARKFYVVEAMIPYAIAFGMIEKFMEQLKSIRPDYHPTWYSGSSPFYSSYSGFYKGVSSNLVTSTSSGRSGGFSGGGGGGGGGGSW